MDFLLPSLLIFLVQGIRQFKTNQLKRTKAVGTGRSPPYILAYIRRKLDPASLPSLLDVFQQLLPPSCICAHTSDSHEETDSSKPSYGGA